MTTLYKELVQIPEEQARWMGMRGWVYQLLMDFLSRPPRMSLIAQWRRRVELKNTIPMCQGGKRLKSYLESIPEENFRRVCYEEAEEFDRLFTGHSAKIAACESLFLAKEKGADAFACLSEIRDTYMESGVVFNKISGEHDDHISLELEFMAVLSEEMLGKVGLRESCLELTDVQIQFLKSHLLYWAPAFSAELAATTTSTLYTGLAELLVEFLEMDLQNLCAWRELQG
ncbi:molecular chaperone [Fontibacillus sp. BL9]|uniref:TorD/DmsD family molecular chaperone n=1 Tax=Fontibacillus sp. BL9 TaxID=3389971 RepID=UPI00397C17EE